MKSLGSTSNRHRQLCHNRTTSRQVEAHNLSTSIEGQLHDAPVSDLLDSGERIAITDLPERADPGGPVNVVDAAGSLLTHAFERHFVIDVPMVGAMSCIGTLIGQRPSWRPEGLPDHDPTELRHLDGGIYDNCDPDRCRDTFIYSFGATEPIAEEVDILASGITVANKQDVHIYPGLTKLNPICRAQRSWNGIADMADRKSECAYQQDARTIDQREMETRRSKVD